MDKSAKKQGLSAGGSIRKALESATVKSLVWVIEKATKSASKKYTKLFILCDVACFVEAWTRITDGKPVDSTNILYSELNEAIEYYMFKDGLSRKDYGLYERDVLSWHYGLSILQKYSRTKIRALYAFVSHHKIADILVKYRNISNYICFRATKDLSKLEFGLGHETSSLYWMERFRRARLPEFLRFDPFVWKISRWLKSVSNKSKRELAKINYVKYDFSFSELASLVAVLGSLTFLLGYLRVMVIFSHFGVRYENYFSIVDYLSVSMAALSRYFPIVVLVFFFQLLFVATLNSYSITPAVPTKRPLSERVQTWYLHVVGLSGVAALVSVFVREHRIDADAFLVSGMYIGIWPLVTVSVRFFESPYKAFLLGGIILTATIDDVADAIRAIEAAQNSTDEQQIIHLQSGTDYSATVWATLGATSDFVILRRRADGMVEVLRKADIRSVTINPAPPPVANADNST